MPTTLASIHTNILAGSYVIIYVIGLYVRCISVQTIFKTPDYQRVMEEIKYKPIGTIHSQFNSIEGMPIQAAGAKGTKGTVELFAEYCDGLKDLEGFSHIILIYDFHLSTGHSLEVKPFLDEEIRGLFATRSPSRPNPIGISIVRLVKVEGCTLYIEDVDIVDKTPLLDIKPYVPDFDYRTVERVGWLSGKSVNAHRKRADRRFAP